MANVLTGLIPELYAAVDVVSRELTGFIPAVSLDASAERAGLNQVIRSPIAPEATAYDISPGATPADNGDQTISYVDMAITKERASPVRWTGNEELSVAPTLNTIRMNQFAESMRKLTNEMDADLGALYKFASRAVSPAGTTLFDAANFKDVANVRKILVDNGAPMDDVSLVMNTVAGAALRGQQLYAAADTAGSTDILRQGILLPVHGINLRESAHVADVAVGTGSGLKTDATGYAVGETEITVASDGSGTILAGDTITFSGDTNRYVVQTGGNMDSGGTVTIAEPGLLKAIPASQADITVVADTQKNMCFARSAIHLLTRAPATPQGGDMADEVQMIVDPRSGLAFEVSLYKQYKRNKIEIAAAWGVKAVKPRHIALLTD